LISFIAFLLFVIVLAEGVIVYSRTDYFMGLVLVFYGLWGMIYFTYKFGIKANMEVN